MFLKNWSSARIRPYKLTLRWEWLAAGRTYHDGCPYDRKTSCSRNAYIRWVFFLSYETQAAHALQMRNYLVQYAYFRDVRKVIKFLTETLPKNMEPRSKQEKPRELVKDWLSEARLEKVFTKIFSGSSMYPIRGLESMDDMHFIHQRADQENW
jgi:hypothetical protein